MNDLENRKVGFQMKVEKVVRNMFISGMAVFLLGIIAFVANLLGVAHDASMLTLLSVAFVMAAVFGPLIWFGTIKLRKKGHEDLSGTMVIMMAAGLLWAFGLPFIAQLFVIWPAHGTIVVRHGVRSLVATPTHPVFSYPGGGQTAYSLSGWWVAVPTNGKSDGNCRVMVSFSGNAQQAVALVDQTPEADIQSWLDETVPLLLTSTLDVVRQLPPDADIYFSTIPAPILEQRGLQITWVLIQSHPHPVS